jgi:hypothetical protein
MNEEKLVASLTALVLTIGVLWFVVSNPIKFKETPETVKTVIKEIPEKTEEEIIRSFKYRSSVEFSYTERGKMNNE